jgi:hypothetical protein
LRYRKKPVIVEAEQWYPGKNVEGVECNPIDNPMTRNSYYIQTLEGLMGVSPGDFIITGIKGEKYACKPDIFEATYEPVND